LHRAKAKKKKTKTLKEEALKKHKGHKARKGAAFNSSSNKCHDIIRRWCFKETAY